MDERTNLFAGLSEKKTRTMNASESLNVKPDAHYNLIKIVPAMGQQTK